MTATATNSRPASSPAGKLPTTREGRFALIRACVFVLPDGSRPRRLRNVHTMLEQMELCSNPAGESRIRIEVLAHKMRVSRKTLFRILDDVDTLGVVDRRQQYSEHGGQESNYWVIRWDRVAKFAGRWNNDDSPTPGTTTPTPSESPAVPTPDTMTSPPSTPDSSLESDTPGCQNDTGGRRVLTPPPCQNDTPIDPTSDPRSVDPLPQPPEKPPASTLTWQEVGELLNGLIDRVDDAIDAARRRGDSPNDAERWIAEWTHERSNDFRSPRGALYSRFMYGKWPFSPAAADREAKRERQRQADRQQRIERLKSLPPERVEMLCEQIGELNPQLVEQIRVWKFRLQFDDSIVVRLMQTLDALNDQRT